MSNLRRFLLYFAQEHLEFRHPEIRSLVKFFNINVKLPEFSAKPYWILEGVTESDLRKIASRSVSLRFIVEIWSSGKSLTEFHANLKQFSNIIDQKFVGHDYTFRVTVESYSKHFKQHEKIEKIESMSYLPLNGTIDLKQPDFNFIYFEYWGMNQPTVPDEPEEIVFGRWVGFN